MENPISKWMIWGENPPFKETSIEAPNSAPHLQQTWGCGNHFSDEEGTFNAQVIQQFAIPGLEW